MTPGPGVGQQCGLMGGVGRAASVELGSRDESKQENLGAGPAGPAEPAQCKGSRSGQHANGIQRRRVLRDMRARTAQKKETISCKVMLGGRARRPIRRRQEPDANGTGMGRRRQYVRDRAENSLYQPPAFGSRASMEDPCQSQSHSRRMVPYGEKQGRGGSLALFTVLTRDGCCSSGTAIARMAAPKKGKKDVTRDGPSSLDHFQISDT